MFSLLAKEINKRYQDNKLTTDDILELYKEEYLTSTEVQKIIKMSQLKQRR